MIWRECSPSKVSKACLASSTLLGEARAHAVELLLGAALQGAQFGLLGAVALELDGAASISLSLASSALTSRSAISRISSARPAQFAQVLVALVDVDEGDHVGGEVDDLLELLGLQLFLGRGAHEEVGQPRPRAAQVPDVHDRGRQGDVAHAVTTDLVTGDLDAAALADDALEADALVLAARALPGLLGPEDLLAEQSVLLGTQGSVVDGLGLLHFARGPTADVLGRGESNAQFVELVDV